jgi:hypothetical protein
MLRVARQSDCLTVDSRGNIYNTGLQKVAFKGVPTRDGFLRRSNF